MSAWFRVYSELVDDPKFIKLGPDLRSALLMMWCVAAGNNGRLPSLEDMAIKFRMSEDKTCKLLNELKKRGFIDDDETGSEPHNWKGRQYKSDVSTDRVKRFRERQRNVSETPPEQNRTESETEEERAAAVAAPSDPRTTLFNRGLQTLERISGRPPNSCRSLVGRWLKDLEDDPIPILGAIEDAELNRVADPVAWITRALKPKGRPLNAATTKDLTRQKWNDALERLGEFASSPTSSDVREEAVRFLPAAGGGKP